MKCIDTLCSFLSRVLHYIKQLLWRHARDLQKNLIATKSICSALNAVVLSGKLDNESTSWKASCGFINAIPLVAKGGIKMIPTFPLVLAIDSSDEDCYPVIDILL